MGADTNPLGPQIDTAHPEQCQAHLFKSVVLLTIRTIPAIAVPVRHHGVLVTKPAVDRRVGGLRPVGGGKQEGKIKSH